MAANPDEPRGGVRPPIRVNGEEAGRSKASPFKSPYASKKSYGGGENARLGSILEEAGLVNEEMIKDLISSQAESAQSLRRSLVQTGLVREDDILDAIAASSHMERVSFGDVDITPDLLEQVPQHLAKKFRVFPVRFETGKVWIALSDPLDINTVDELHFHLGKEVIGCVAPEEEIARNIRRYYEGDEITAIYEKTIEAQDEGTTEQSMGFADYSKVDLDANASDEDQDRVVRFVDLLFRTAIKDRASDIHVEPSKRGVDIRFRVDGVLRHMPNPPKGWQNQIIARLKVLSGMDLAEKRVPQDGRIKLNIEGRKLDLRVSALPSYFGESVVMRILDQSSVMLGLEEVGFLPDNVARFQKIIRSPNGIVLMTGPTGSGKTTTLYAALSSLNNAETKIITIENPVEYQIAGINQVQVDEEVGLTFSTALRAMLRQSPDVILVGEIRDLETAEIGIRAALTGHLVFSTLHTNDAASASIRLVDMGIKPYLVGSSVAAVIAQRLVRRICAQCKRPYQPTPGELVEMEQDPQKCDGMVFYKGDGCERCNNMGYRGRTAIHEIMEVDTELRRMIIRMEASTRVKAEAVKRGMRTLRMDGFEKILLGQTTFEEVLRITQED